MQLEIQNDILSYAIFPHKVATVAQKEMWKTKHSGGLKLVNIQLKSETSKAKWLFEMAPKENPFTNLTIFTRLMGTQRGNIKGTDLLFLHKPYFTRSLSFKSPINQTNNFVFTIVSGLSRESTIFLINWFLLKKKSTTKH